VPPVGTGGTPTTESPADHPLTVSRFSPQRRHSELSPPSAPGVALRKHATVRRAAASVRTAVRSRELPTSRMTRSFADSATWSGVAPSLSSAAGSARAAISTMQTDGVSAAVAQCSAVRRALPPAAFTLAPCSSSIRTMRTLDARTAQSRAVYPASTSLR